MTLLLWGSSFAVFEISQVPGVFCYWRFLGSRLAADISIEPADLTAVHPSSLSTDLFDYAAAFPQATRKELAVQKPLP